MPQKQKPEEEQEEKKEEEEEEEEFTDKEKLVGTFYVLHNLKERFQITKTEEYALDYAIYLVNRERRGMEEGGYEDGIYEGEDDDETATQKPTGLRHVPGMVSREVPGYA